MASSTQTNHQQRSGAALAPPSLEDRPPAAPAVTETRGPANHCERTLALGGSRTDRWIGMWSARALFALGVSYAVIMIVGFAAMGGTSKPLEDPYLAIMEILILIQAPILVLLAVVIHACAPERTRTYSMTALGWMLVLAGFTVTVHLVQLTVVRRIDPAAIHGFQYLFNWHWPSMLYGIDIVAWDIFFGLALLFAAPVFHAAGHIAVRNGMLLAGAMSVAGIVGPAANHIALRQIGIVGYAIIWPIVCLPLSRVFQRQPAAAAAAAAPEREPEGASHDAGHENSIRAS
jgi:hypothetical protein